MQYLCLIYSEEQLEPKPGTPEFDAHINAYRAFGEEHGKQIVGGNALESVTNATTVRMRDGLTEDVVTSILADDDGNFWLELARWARARFWASRRAGQTSSSALDSGWADSRLPRGRHRPEHQQRPC